MSIPIFPADFIAIGARFASEDIVAEIDRMAPLAAADIALLATRGYAQSDLDQLTQYRDALVAESADRKQQRGAKKGSRATEAAAIGEGKILLRSGVVLARSALQKRTPPPGETPEQTKATMTDVLARIDSLGGRIGLDSAKLRTQLTNLVSVLALPALAPSPADTQARADFVAKVQGALAALPDLAEQKKAAQQEAKLDTMSLDEIDGRAYTNLKLLAQVGRAYWNEHKNRKRAAEYQLNGLHERTSKPKPEATGAPAGGGG